MQRRAASQIVRGAPAKGRSPGQVTSGQVTSDAHHTRAAGAEVRHLRHTSCRALLGPVPLARDSAHDTQREMVSSRDSRRGIPTVEWVVVPNGEQHVPFGGAGDQVHEPRADGVDGVGRVDAVLQVACVRGLGAKEVSVWMAWRRSA